MKRMFNVYQRKLKTDNCHKKHLQLKLFSISGVELYIEIHAEVIP